MEKAPDVLVGVTTKNLAFSRLISGETLSEGTHTPSSSMKIFDASAKKLETASFEVSRR